MALNSGGFNWDVSSGLAQGISDAGRGIAQGIAQLSADLKKTKAYRAMAVDALGMDPEAVDKMSLPQLEGQFQAVAVKNAMEGVKQRRQEHDQLMEMRARQMMAQQTAAADRAGYDAEVAQMMAPRILPDAPAGMMDENGVIPPGAHAPAGGVPEFNPQAFMGVAARHHQLSPDMVSRFMEARDHAGPNQIDTIDLPFGNKGVSVRGSRDLKVLENPENRPKTQEAVDYLTRQRIASVQNELKEVQRTIARGVGVQLDAEQMKPWLAREQALKKQLAAMLNPAEERVTVADKNGKQFTVPKSQVEEAQKQGYSLVQ